VCVCVLCVYVFPACTLASTICVPLCRRERAQIGGCAQVCVCAWLCACVCACVCARERERERARERETERTQIVDIYICIHMKKKLKR